MGGFDSGKVDDNEIQVFKEMVILLPTFNDFSPNKATQSFVKWSNGLLEFFFSYDFSFKIDPKSWPYNITPPLKGFPKGLGEKCGGK